jgi:hypothetical protein
MAKRYQRGSQNPYTEEEQTTQWPKEKGQKDKQRSTKHTYKTKDRVTRTPQKPGVNAGAPKGKQLRNLDKTNLHLLSKHTITM